MVESTPQVVSAAATMRIPAQHDAGSVVEQRSSSVSKIPQVKNFEKLRANSQMQKRRSSSKSKLRNPTKITVGGALADATEKNVNKYQN